MSARHVEIQVVGDTHGTVSPLRARVLDPAPPPEDHRGSAVAGVDDGLRERWARRRRGGRAVGYVGAGTVEFMLDRRRVLLPRDEHPAPGRAPGHRDDHRSRPGADQILVAEGAPLPRDVPTRRSTGTPSRLASTPRIRRTTSCPSPERCTASACPSTSESTAGSATGPRSPCTTTRCSPRSSPTPHQGGGALDPGPGARRG